jgi:hypothetical protein
MRTTARRGLKRTYVLQENLEDSASLFVDEAGDTLDTTTAGKTTDSGLKCEAQLRCCIMSKSEGSGVLTLVIPSFQRIM